VESVENAILGAGASLGTFPARVVLWELLQVAKTSSAAPMVSFVVTVRTTPKTRSFCSLLATEDRLLKLEVEFNTLIFTTDRTNSAVRRLRHFNLRCSR